MEFAGNSFGQVANENLIGIWQLLKDRLECCIKRKGPINEIASLLDDAAEKTVVPMLEMSRS